MAGAGTGVQFFSSEEYTIGPNVKLSLPQISFLLSVHPGFNLLHDPQRGDVVLVSDKQTILWKFLTLWVEDRWPDFVEQYVESVRESARAFYKNTEVRPCGLDTTLSPRPRYGIFAGALDRFNKQLGSQLGNLESLIANLVRQCDRTCKKLEERGLLQDPVTFEWTALPFIFATICNLSRGSYYRLTKNGQVARKEISIGLLHYKSENRDLVNKKGGKEVSLEWNVPINIIKLLLRAVGTFEKILRGVLDPDGKLLDSGDGKEKKPGSEDSKEHKPDSK